ncbi:hypothetical protein KDL44_11115 [bacterium]|nr:hypothetical protein [bacterium]
MRFYSMLLAAVMAIMVLPGIANAEINAETRAEAIARIQERDPNYGGGAHAGGSHAAANMGMHRGDSAWEEFWVQDIDFRPFMSRLHTVLMEDPGLAECGARDDIMAFLEQMYLFNMGTMHSEMAITGDDISFMFSETVHELPEDSGPARMLALPDRELESFNLVDNGDFMLYLGLQHVPAKLMIQLDEVMKQQEMAEGMDGPLGEIFGGMDIEELQQSLALMKAMQIDKMVDNSLSGEIAIALFDMPELGTLMENNGMGPDEISAAVAIGIKDPAYVREMIGTYGSEVGITPRADSGANGWDVFDVPMMPGLGIVMNDSLLVATTDVDGVLGRMGDQPVMEAGACQVHMVLNMAALNGKFVAPGMKLLATEISDDEETYWPVDSMKYLWNVPEEEGLGYMTMSSRFDGSASCEMHMKKAVFQYLMYYMSTIGAGAIQSELH